MAGQSSTPWWQSYFSRVYGELYRGPLAEDLATETEVETLARLFADGRRLADVGCGFGRHLVPLRERGLNIFGFDYSKPLLEMAGLENRPHLARADLRRLPLADRSLGGVCMMFNTFGYFDEQENRQVLREAARVLSDGGRLVMDLPSRTGMIKAAREQPAAIRAQEDYSMSEHWKYDEQAGRLRASGRWETPDGIQDWELSMKLYTPGELRKMLGQAGFRGPIEFRPLEEIDALGTEQEAPPLTAGVWRTATNMAVLAHR